MSLNKEKKHNIAVVGASGLVGRKILQILEEYKIKINKLYLFSSPKSAGNLIYFNKKSYKLIELNKPNIDKIKNIDYVFFAAGGVVSKEYVSIFVDKGATVIDNSSRFRMVEGVPLVVPEVNPETLKNKKIISNPNCSTIQAVVALAPLHKRYKIKRIIFSTYQAVSGAGERGGEDLKNQILEYSNKTAQNDKNKKSTKLNKKSSQNMTLKNDSKSQAVAFQYPIFNNILPHIDVFCVDGYTREEYKMINETRKILNDPDIKISATAVRVPIFNCHCESINVEFEKQCDLNEIKKIFSNTKGIVLLDDTSKNIYPMPNMCVDKDEVFVGRIRIDETVPSGVNLFVVADNLRKGAATNAVQILQILIDKKLKKF